jgi:hypothetical protein
MKSKTDMLGERFIAAFLAVSPEGQAAIFASPGTNRLSLQALLVI